MDFWRRSCGVTRTEKNNYLGYNRMKKDELVWTWTFEKNVRETVAIRNIPLETPIT